MFGLGISELLVVLLLVMLIFGAGKLPEVGTALGRAIRGFKKGMHESDTLDLPQTIPEEGPRNREGPAQDT